MAREAVWISGLTASYRDAEEALERLARIHISRSSIWLRVQSWGARFQEIEHAARERTLALPEHWQPPSRQQVPDQRLGVAMDGFMVHLREEGWKELKVGVVYDVGVRLAKNPETGEQEPQAQAVNPTYTAYLGGPERFGEMVYTEARRRGWEQAQDRQTIGDGAAWIWNLVDEHFPDSVQTLDWYHATEHLTEAAKLLKGENTPAMQRWLNSRKTALYQGHADQISCELEQAAAEKGGEVGALLKREAGYFWEHQHRMGYLELREEEWPIGSGMAESGGERFQARLVGPGMRWSRDGVENLIPVRAAVLSERFDAMWKLAYTSPPK